MNIQIRGKSRIGAATRCFVLLSARALHSRYQFFYRLARGEPMFRGRQYWKCLNRKRIDERVYPALLPPPRSALSKIPY